jgi:ABC-2 type transport system ATP-binding protein
VADGLEASGLHRRYGEITALDDCSLSVPPGRVVGLLGPNGAGKTTAMRCLFGLVQPDRGTVTFDGRHVDRETRRRFGYMPEERGLYPRMPVRAQLEYLARLSGLDRRRARAGVDRWLERLGLAPRADVRVDALSHGNQQRVQLAAALVHDPALLVLDEPFAGLDPLGVEALADVIAELAHGGSGVLFSSHQLDLVEHVCQDVVIVDRGHVALSGELTRLRSDTDRRYVEIGFLGEGRWTPRVPCGRVLAAEPGHTRIELTGPADLAELARIAGTAGEVTRFSLEPPALSDLFHAAVGR